MSIRDISEPGQLDREHCDILEDEDAKGDTEKDHISRPHRQLSKRNIQGPEDDETNRRIDHDAITTGSDDDQL